MMFSYQHGQETYNVQLDAAPDGSYTARIGDRVYAVQVTAIPGGWLLNLNGERIPVYAATDGKNRYVKAGKEPVLTLATSQGQSSRRRKSGAQGDSQLTAQMPGQVVEVYVKAGDTVTSGQTLVVLEAMKMEIRISAPADGVVKQVMVKKGDVVEREQLLIEVETP